MRASGLSRRQLLARGAIAGGVVWAAPVIRTTAAYATTANGTERPCSNFYMVVINPAGQVRAAPGNTQAGSVPPAIRAWFRDNPGVTVQFPAVTPQLTSVSSDAAAVLLPEVTGPNAAGRQCRIVIGWARKGNLSEEGFVDPKPPIAVEVGRRLVFPCPNQNSHHDGGNNGAHSDSLAATGSVAADGATAGTVGSDGATNPTIGSDGGPSSGTSGGDGGTGVDNGTCFTAIYLIYCCPR